MNRFRLLIVLALPGLMAVSPLRASPDPQKDPKYCGSCHQRIYKEWSGSRMGQDLNNDKVYQFYAGTNPAGQKDGLGFQPLMHGEKGDCADCHVPQLVLDEHKAGREVDLGVAMKEKLDHGISCHFCHTISEVKVQQDADGRYKTRIIDSVVQGDPSTMNGPFDNAESPAHATRDNPLIRDSKVCAVCHLNQEKFLSISQYQDWKQAYDSGKTDKTCQQCHMPLIDEPVLLADTITDRPKRSGTRAHTFIGASDDGMLRQALTLDVNTRIEGDKLIVDTVVENVGAGHKVPGSGPIRNVILKIDVLDDKSQPLRYVGDKRGLLSPLAGSGNPKTKQRDANDWGGMPGKMYAKVYKSKPIENMGNKPMVGVGGFMADSLLFDTALKPLEPDQTRFEFALPASGEVRVSARLVYRDAFKPLSDRKGWTLSQREMNQVVRRVTVP